MKLKEIDANQNAAKLSDAERLEQEMKMGYSSDLMIDLNQPKIGNWIEKLTFLFCSSRMSVDVIKHQLFFDKFETNIRIKEKNLRMYHLLILPLPHFLKELLQENIVYVPIRE